MGTIIRLFESRAMILLDTSVVIPVVRQKTTDAFERLLVALGAEDFALSRMTEMELMQGARDDAEWARLQKFVDVQDIVDLEPSGWRRAASTYFDLRRKGVTISSALDCCIAQVALDRDLTLIHNDGDYEMIARVRPLKERRFAPLDATPRS